MYPNVDGMLALAIVAMKVNFVCRHEPSFIITPLNCNDIKIVKFVYGCVDSNPSARPD
jgi:hypothetical protein